jgi:hypothetical protein
VTKYRFVLVFVDCSCWFLLIVRVGFCWLHPGGTVVVGTPYLEYNHHRTTGTANNRHEPPFQNMERFATQKIPPRTATNRHFNFFVAVHTATYRHEPPFRHLHFLSDPFPIPFRFLQDVLRLGSVSRPTPIIYIFIL